MRRLALIAVLAAVVAGCGDDKPVSLPEDDKGGQERLTYRGKTSQGEPISIRVADGARTQVPLDLKCQDGTDTRVTVTTEPKIPELQADGSFYYSETGRSDFRGFGQGRYRAAVQGQLQGARGSGSASFRISFRSTSCRGTATWTVRRV